MRKGVSVMGTVIVRGGASGFAQEVQVDRHRLMADEPEAAGGTDAGPSPYDFLLVALGS
jgi:putative redox protein